MMINDIRKDYNEEYQKIKNNSLSRNSMNMQELSMIVFWDFATCNLSGIFRCFGGLYRDYVSGKHL